MSGSCTIFNFDALNKTSSALKVCVYEEVESLNNIDGKCDCEEFLTVLRGRAFWGLTRTPEPLMAPIGARIRPPDELAPLWMVLTLQFAFRLATLHFRKVVTVSLFVVGLGDIHLIGVSLVGLALMDVLQRHRLPRWLIIIWAEVCFFAVYLYQFEVVRDFVLLLLESLLGHRPVSHWGPYNRTSTEPPPGADHRPPPLNPNALALSPNE